MTIIGLDAGSFAALRSYRLLKYRTRIGNDVGKLKNGEYDIGYTITLFWCRSIDEVEQQFLAHGLIGPETEWSRYPYGNNEREQGLKAFWAWRDCDAN